MCPFTRPSPKERPSILEMNALFVVWFSASVAAFLCYLVAGVLAGVLALFLVIGLWLYAAYFM